MDLLLGETVGVEIFEEEELLLWSSSFLIFSIVIFRTTTACDTTLARLLSLLSNLEVKSPLIIFLAEYADICLSDYLRSVSVNMVCSIFDV